MKQPDGFQISGKEDYVCRLKKSLYGLKQAPRQWYKKFESVMCEQGYKKTTSDHCVFVRKFFDDDFVILLLYVDDMLIVGKSISRIDSPSNEAEKTNMSIVPYASAVGSLMYAMVCTRPDIAHVVGIVSRFLSNPSKEYWNAVKWILRYLRSTSDLRLCFEGDKPTLVGYSDSDMARDIDSIKSTSGYLIKFAGGVCVALSTTEAEFIAITEACKELLWVKKFLQELGFVQDKYLLFCDSQSVIHLGKNSTFHSRSKHIDVRYHWIHDALDAKLLELAKVHTDDNGANMMTKVVPRGKFEACCEIAGLAITST
ncbi:hypothetical protein CR513_45467, partial [Mucuna pruriens]